MNDTFEQTVLAAQVSRSISGKKVLEVDAWHGFRAENWRENLLMKQFLGLLKNAPFLHSARLPKEHPFQWVQFEIIWSIL
jgi:hypothetical protein